jgi:EAL domain-containing protein (putative c-di-GMP-specific phosphodiesterase class I)/GGDEF domain-containing protein
MTAIQDDGGMLSALDGHELTSFLENDLARRHGTDKPLAYLGIQLIELTKTAAAFGITAREELLHAIAANLRATLPRDATLFHVQTNTFGIVLPDADYNKTPQIVRTVTSIFEKPFLINGIPIFVEIAIGIAVYPHHATDANGLRQAAAAAIIEAQSKSQTSCIYDPVLHRKQTDGLALVSELKGAIEDRQLELWYQPKVGLIDGRQTGAEALIRWRHPTRNLLMPGHFIEFAENTGLMTDVTTWVLKTAAEDLTHWGESGMKISVNLSAKDLLTPGIDELVGNLLHYYQIDPEMLELEVTESALVINPSRAIRTLRDLQKLGVKVAIDDFGAGHASLRYLADFPVSVVKIDQRFARTLCTDPKCAKIVEAIINLCHGLDLTVVAEGVETEDVCDWLRGHGCDSVQGYYLARPMPKKEYEAWTDAHKDEGVLTSRSSAPSLRVV